MSKRKLLLADDSVTIQKVVNLTFADEGIDVITVGDGDSAMAKIAEMAPDVILADVHMPGLSGYQVCEMVRSNEATKGLPVVLLVGSFEPFDENEAARVGANAFLTKPFQSIRQLVSQVSDLMQASAPVSEPVIEQPPPVATEIAAPEEEIDRTTPVRVPDTTDIDKLYAQSVGGGPSDGDAESGRPTYLDAGMDDEMIDTVHAGGDAVVEEPSDGFYQEPTAEYSQPTDEYQLETAEFQEPITGYEQPVGQPQYQEPVAEFEQATAEQPQYQEPEFEQPTAEQPQYQEPVAEFEQPTAEQPQYQYPVDEYREPTVEHHEPAAAYEQPTESIFEEHVPPVPSPFDAPAEETPLVDLPTFETTPQYSSPQSLEDASTAQTDEFELDEIDLLELPPVEGGQTIEFTTRPGPDGSRQVVSLSPELMDALVEKVVKKLSKNE